MTKSALAQSVVVAALALLWASPGDAQTPGSPGAVPPAAQPRFPATSFLAPTKATWDSTRTLVLGIADSVSEDKYDFKPTPAVRSFREILVHLIGENCTFFSRVSGDNLGSNARFDASSASSPKIVPTARVNAREARTSPESRSRALGG